MENILEEIIKRLEKIERLVTTQVRFSVINALLGTTEEEIQEETQDDFLYKR